MVDHLNAHRIGFRPEGQLHGAVECGRSVAVFDRVAHRLVHREHEVVLVIPREGERAQPAAYLRTDTRQMAGMCRPDPMGELSGLSTVKCCLAHLGLPGACSVPRSSADGTTGGPPPLNGAPPLRGPPGASSFPGSPGAAPPGVKSGAPPGESPA